MNCKCHVIFHNNRMRGRLKIALKMVIQNNIHKQVLHFKMSYLCKNSCQVDNHIYLVVFSSNEIIWAITISVVLLIQFK